MDKCVVLSCGGDAFSYIQSSDETFVAARTRLDAFLPLTPPMLHTLVALADGDKHGYAILKEIARRTDGAVRLSAGTLYALSGAPRRTA